MDNKTLTGYVIRQKRAAVRQAAGERWIRFYLVKADADFYHEAMGGFGGAPNFEVIEATLTVKEDK